MTAETAQHAGHAGIARELIDGTFGSDHDMADEAAWRKYLAQVRAAADTFAGATGPAHTGLTGADPA